MVPGCTACAQVITDDVSTRLAVPSATITNPLSSASSSLVDAGMSLKLDAGDEHRVSPSGFLAAVTIGAFGSSAASAEEVTIAPADSAACICWGLIMRERQPPLFAHVPGCTAYT